MCTLEQMLFGDHIKEGLSGRMCTAHSVMRNTSFYLENL
jgi:hypothetical protein